MTEPIINIHVVVDPALPQTWTRLNSGSEDRIRVLDSIHSKVRDVVPLIEVYKQQLEDKAKHLKDILEETYKTYLIESFYSQWDTLDVVVYQAASNNVSAIEVGGVGGDYGNGDDISSRQVFGPYARLYILPGFEDRMEATVLHEFGHFLRYRATSDTSFPYFNHAIFEEGLSESLVKAILGEEHVYHKQQITYVELLKLKSFIEESLSDETSGEAQRTITKFGYRLGYRLVQHLISNGQDLKDLFKLSRRESSQEVFKYCQQLLIEVN
ncbi:DUF2268 domain-containing putative Zn-dependent protease [Deinococcus sp.]|uniref:DUF2268 domain-containing putative Zn-dependent protease n=1 Tax=Deinococcus sp. TaxID=47478 RepID=UPI0025EB6245|nr:DUF2268 domain-containing putative Zn-dependent protease [Deinococcus sp.]